MASRLKPKDIKLDYDAEGDVLYIYFGEPREFLQIVSVRRIRRPRFEIVSTTMGTSSN